MLCLFLGALGVHKFYEGKVGMGILYLGAFTGVLSDVLGTVYQWIVGGAGGLMTLLVRALGLF